MFKELFTEINEVADTFRVRSMVQDVAKAIIKNDKGKVSTEELTKAVLQKHRTLGNDSMASKELISWGKDAESFVRNIVKDI